MELENLEDLIDLTISTEERLFLSQLSENAAYCPDVNSKAVLFLTKQNFGGTIPESLNLMSECFNGKREGSSKSEICNFESSCSINEKILGLKIPMDDPPSMAVVDAIAKLVEK